MSKRITFKVADLEIIKTLTPKKMGDPEKLIFGHTFTDHMLYSEWNEDTGWNPIVIKPWENLSLAPSATVFHYGVACFEGLKAYKDSKGNVRLFRPEMNMVRMLKSAERLALPSFDANEALECIKKYVLMEKSWIPSQKGYTLYIRPTIIGAQEWLGVGPSNRAIFFVISCPVGPYYRPTAFAPVSLWAENKFVRAWPGGTGQYKVGGNYAPGILPQLQVSKKGYQQILWLFGPDNELTEVGTMNLFVFWKRPSDGKKELRTASLKDGTILPGVTRDSILKLTKEWNEFEVTEGKITMNEVLEALKQGNLIEMFGAGTAAIISPIKNIHFQGKDYTIPLDKDDPNALAGPLARKLWKNLSDIQYGDIDHEWSCVVK